MANSDFTTIHVPDGLNEPVSRDPPIDKNALEEKLDKFSSRTTLATWQSEDERTQNVILAVSKNTSVINTSFV